MYIFEFINKKILNLLGKKEHLNKIEENKEMSEYEKCEHVFMPVDSTGKILACSKCGLLIHKE
jgi:hypothetical protein